jgi:hypothetical protein
MAANAIRTRRRFARLCEVEAVFFNFNYLILKGECKLVSAGRSIPETQMLLMGVWHLWRRCSIRRGGGHIAPLAILDAVGRIKPGRRIHARRRNKLLFLRYFFPTAR